MLGFLKISLGLFEIGKLHVQNAASQVKTRGIGLQIKARVDHLDAGLERLVGKRNIRKVQVESDVARVFHDRISQDLDCLRCVATGLIHGGRQLHGAHFWVAYVQQRLQCGNGLLRFFGYKLNRRQGAAGARSFRVRCHELLENGDCFIHLLQGNQASAVLL